MKKILLAAALIALATALQAQIINSNLLSEYKVADVLERSTYSARTEPIKVNTWCGAFVTNPVTNLVSPIIGNPLTYSGYNEGGPSIVYGSGYAAGVRGRRTSVYSLTDGKKIFGGTYYLSCLVNFSKISSTKMSEFASFSTNHMGGSNRGTLFVMRDPADKQKMRFGVSLIDAIAEDATLYNLNTTYLVVLKVDYKRSEATLFVNPVLDGAEPQPLAKADAAGKEFKHAIRAIAIRNSDGYKGSIGNFRLSSSWDGVKAQ